MARLEKEMIAAVKITDGIIVSYGTMEPGALCAKLLNWLEPGTDDVQSAIFDIKDLSERYAELYDIFENAVFKEFDGKYLFGTHPDDGACLGIWPREFFED